MLPRQERSAFWERIKKKTTNNQKPKTNGTKHSPLLGKRWFRGCLGIVGLGQPKLGLPCPKSKTWVTTRWIFIASSEELSAGLVSSILNQRCNFLALGIIFHLKLFYCNFKPVQLILMSWQSPSCCWQCKRVCAEYPVLWKVPDVDLDPRSTCRTPLTHPTRVRIRVKYTFWADRWV